MSRWKRVAYNAAVSGRLLAERSALAVRLPRAAPTARVLAYHSTGTPSWGVNDISAARFERHLQIAADEGWTFATPEQVRADPASKLLAITFDDGVRSVLDHAAPVLRSHGIPATMFVVSGWADGLHPDGSAELLDWRGVEQLREHGFSLGCHSVTHPDFGTLDAGQMERELADSRARLEQVLGEPVREFAIPFGQSSNWPDEARRLAAAIGYENVYAQAGNTRPSGTLARTFITRYDQPRLFRAALAGAYDDWEEWYP